MATLDELLGMGEQFSPFSGAGRNIQYRNIVRRGRSRRRRGDILARLSGLDPFAQQGALQGLDEDIAGQQGDQFGQADLEELGAGRSFYGNLLGRRLDRDEQMRQERERRRAQRRAFLGGLGGLAGRAGLAALTGGASLPFSFLGGGGGGSGGGGPYDGGGFL